MLAIFQVVGGGAARFLRRRSPPPRSLKNFLGVSCYFLDGWAYPDPHQSSRITIVRFGIRLPTGEGAGTPHVGRRIIDLGGYFDIFISMEILNRANLLLDPKIILLHLNLRCRDQTFANRASFCYDLHKLFCATSKSGQLSTLHFSPMFVWPEPVGRPIGTTGYSPWILLGQLLKKFL